LHTHNITSLFDTKIANKLIIWVKTTGNEDKNGEECVKNIKKLITYYRNKMIHFKANRWKILKQSSQEIFAL